MKILVAGWLSPRPAVAPMACGNTARQRRSRERLYSPMRVAHTARLYINTWGVAVMRLDSIPGILYILIQFAQILRPKVADLSSESQDLI